MLDKASWIKSSVDMGDISPNYFKLFIIEKAVIKATLTVTALGVYEARLNNSRISEYVLAPGFTSYDYRLQYQTYDITSLMKEKNRIDITVGKGWYRSRIEWIDRRAPIQERWRSCPPAMIAHINIEYSDGTTDEIVSDMSWNAEESCIRFSEIYHGEIYDASFVPEEIVPVELYDGPSQTLIPQEGEIIKEHERVQVASMLRTPAGEWIVDFGQEITGYVEIRLEAKQGEIVDLSFAEVLDKYGNFYNENYRTAKCQYIYVCKDGNQTYKPKMTFYGFRYVKINAFPGNIDDATAKKFTAIVVHSEMRRTGYIHTSNPLLNRMFENVIWGQKGNFLDIPTDCPQRDERLGWTGDAQVFVRTACLNYDVEKFFKKWLGCMRAEQWENGLIPKMVPDPFGAPVNSAAWGDAVTICPWEIYLAYGDISVLQKQFQAMKGWVNYITTSTHEQYLWTGGARHYGDWLGLDAAEGTLKGATRDDFIATVFYAYSTYLIIKVGKILNENIDEFEQLYWNIKMKFQETYPKYETQTECILAAHFDMAANPQAAADQLVEMIHSCGGQFKTGFVGTPYLLHTLSQFGYTKIAYSLLLREEYPSWLYQIKKGATTIWEHWDGIKEDGSFWDSSMNSFNHYAYGSVADWMYGVAAGITPIEEAPGYKKVSIAPMPDMRLGWFEAVLNTRHGRISSKWVIEGNRCRYEIITPVDANITIDGVTSSVKAGAYLYYSYLK